MSSRFEGFIYIISNKFYIDKNTRKIGFSLDDEKSLMAQHTRDLPGAILFAKYECNNPHMHEQAILSITTRKIKKKIILIPVTGDVDWAYKILGSKFTDHRTVNWFKEKDYLLGIFCKDMKDEKINTI